MIHRVFRISVFVSIIILLSTSVVAQEMMFKSFTHLEGNTNGRIYRKRDVNGQNCALLIIKHNFSNFEVESGKDYEALEEKTGETWVWLSPDEYILKIRKEGYLPFTFNLKDKLKPLETYDLIITDEYATLKIVSPTANIGLDNKTIGIDSCETRLKSGSYNIRVSKEKYYEKSFSVILNAGENKRLEIGLKPILGSLTISSNPQQAEIYLDNHISDEKTPASIPLIIGSYNLKLKKEGYLPYQQEINIYERRNTDIEFSLTEDPAITLARLKRNATIWSVTSLSLTGLGVYSVIHSNSLYQDYQIAGSSAAEIKKDVENWDKIKYASLGGAGATALITLIYFGKYRKLNKSYTLSVAPLNDGIYAGLIYKF